MSDESTSGDTSAEVERIRAQRAAADNLPCRQQTKPLGRYCKRCGADASSGCAGGSVVGIQIVDPLLAALDRVTAERDAAELAVDTWVATEAEALTERLEAANACVDIFRKRVTELTAERDALAARLPSPESVTRARLVAAEIVDVAVAEERYWRARTSPRPDPRPDRDVATACAAHIRDRARTHSGTHDEGGDVDERELLWCAARVDECTTLGELEALVARWREVAA